MTDQTNTNMQPSNTVGLHRNDSNSQISIATEDDPRADTTASRIQNLHVPQPQQQQRQDDRKVPAQTGPTLGVTGPPAETGLPPARPSAAHAAISDTVDITDSLNSSNRLSQGRSFNDGSSRPTTGGSRSHFSAGSRSHAASYRNQPFFQPMSSQRLQQQRGVRPMSAAAHTRDGSTSLESGNIEDDAQSRTERNSMGTVPEAVAGRSPRGLQTQYFEDENTVPPTSRGSDVTDRNDWPPHAQETNRGLINGNMRYEAAQSMDTFHDTDQAQKSTILDPEKAYAPGQQEQASRSRSPRDFVTAFGRKSQQDSPKTNGHEKLSSRDSTSIQKQPAQDNKKLGKNWEYFDGNTMFMAGGRLETAKDKPIVVGTGAAVVIPSALWFAFVAPYTWHNISPAVPIIFAYIFFITMSSFFHACFSDPGILPRNLHPFPPADLSDDPLALGPPTTAWTMIMTGKSKGQTAFEVPTKFCKSCQIWRPPRCHHCRVCDNCIDTQDHHCVWLNNCVGRRNYRYFFHFVGFGAVLGIYLFATSVAQISHYASANKASFSTALGATAANGVAFFLFLYGLLAFAYPLALWGYHDFLIAQGLTTREYLNSNKFLKKDRHRPFDLKSFWMNFVAVLTRPRAPSYLEFKKAYQTGDQRFGIRRSERPPPEKKSKEVDGGQVEMQQFEKPKRGFQGGFKGMMEKAKGATRGGEKE